MKNNTNTTQEVGLDKWNIVYPKSNLLENDDEFVIESNKRLVAKVPIEGNEEEAEANAKRIVTAVNNFEALRNALLESRKRLRVDCYFNHDDDINVKLGRKIDELLSSLQNSNS